MGPECLPVTFLSDAPRIDFCPLGETAVSDLLSHVTEMLTECSLLTGDKYFELSSGSAVE